MKKRMLVRTFVSGIAATVLAWSSSAGAAEDTMQQSSQEQQQQTSEGAIGEPEATYPRSVDPRESERHQTGTEVDPRTGTETPSEGSLGEDPAMGGTGSRSGSAGSMGQEPEEETGTGMSPTGGMGTQQDRGSMQQSQQRRQQTRVTSETRDWVRQVAQANQTELQLAQLAQQKAQSPAVKSFAREMVSDHRRLGNQLQQVSSQLGVQVPSSAGEDARSKREELSKLSGQKFDKEFVNTIVEEHKKVIDQFEKQAESQDANPQLRDMAIETLPKLRRHLVSAWEIQEQLESGSR